MVQVVVDPSNAQVVYAATNERGVLKSRDAGATWSASSSGLRPTSICTLAVDPANPQTIYAGSGFLSPMGLHKSTNGGASWQSVSTALLESRTICRVRIDPQNSNALYVATDAGLFKTQNAGTSWRKLAVQGAPLDDLRIEDVIIDPVQSDKVYAAPAAPDAVVARSVDAGETWQLMPLTTYWRRAPTRLALDPQQHNRVLAALPFNGLIEQEVAPDLGIAVSGAAGGSYAVGRVSTIILRAANLGPYAATQLKLTGELPVGGAESLRVQPNRGSCSVAGRNLSCLIGSLPSGNAAEVRIDFTPTEASMQKLDVGIDGEERDLVAGNDRVSATYQFVQGSSPPANTGTAGALGGGGVFGPWLLMLLMTLVAPRLRLQSGFKS